MARRELPLPLGLWEARGVWRAVSGAQPAACGRAMTPSGVHTDSLVSRGPQFRSFRSGAAGQVSGVVVVKQLLEMGSDSLRAGAFHWHCDWENSTHTN